MATLEIRYLWQRRSWRFPMIFPRVSTGYVVPTASTLVKGERDAVLDGCAHDEERVAGPRRRVGRDRQDLTAILSFVVQRIDLFAKPFQSIECRGRWHRNQGCLVPKGRMSSVVGQLLNSRARSKRVPQPRYPPALSVRRSPRRGRRRRERWSAASAT